MRWGLRTRCLRVSRVRFRVRSLRRIRQVAAHHRRQRRRLHRATSFLRSRSFRSRPSPHPRQSNSRRLPRRRSCSRRPSLPPLHRPNPPQQPRRARAASTPAPSRCPRCRAARFRSASTLALSAGAPQATSIARSCRPRRSCSSRRCRARSSATRRATSVSAICSTAASRLRV
jgi:hypothetical protein